MSTTGNQLPIGHALGVAQFPSVNRYPRRHMGVVLRDTDMAAAAPHCWRCQSAGASLLLTASTASPQPLLTLALCSRHFAHHSDDILRPLTGFLLTIGLLFHDILYHTTPFPFLLHL